MADGLSELLAMRLRDASLDGLCHIAEEKLAALQGRGEPPVTEGIRNANFG